MARIPSKRGLNVGVDANELNRFTDKLDDVIKKTPTAIAQGLNSVGDQVVSLVASKLAQSTGLTIEQVRGQMTVKRAKRGALTFEVQVNSGLMEGRTEAEKLEGRRESTDFGQRRPRQLVIIVSREDELVCPDCEELAAAGPMPIEAAREHIPKHPNCRCVILPYTPKGKRLPVTMTTVSGTDPRKRMGGKAPVNVDLTLRQIATEVINKSMTKLRLELK